jgi:hypothetical protein
MYLKYMKIGEHLFIPDPYSYIFVYVSLQTHKVGNDITTEEISNVSEDSTGLNDEMQLLPENLPFLCCKTCLVVYKTHKEFEVHVCKNGGNSLDEGTILVSSFLFL